MLEAIKPPQIYIVYLILAGRQTTAKSGKDMLAAHTMPV
jgi:hypothetical protein